MKSIRFVSSIPDHNASIRDLDTISIMARVFHSENEELLKATLFDHLKSSTIAFLDEPERLIGLLEETDRTDLTTAIQEMPRIMSSSLFGPNVDVINFQGTPQPGTSIISSEPLYRNW